MALMAAVLLVYSYQRESAQRVRDTVAMARALSSVVDRELAAVESALQVLATSPHLKSDDLAAFDAQAREALSNHAADNVVLTDAAGRQRVNTFRSFGAPLPQQEMPQLRKVLDSRRPVVSDLFTGPLMQRPALSVSVPVFRDGRVHYNLSMGFFPDRLSAILEEQRLPPGWIGELFDGGGNLVARTHQPERFVGQRAALWQEPEIREHAAGAVEMLSAEGIPVIATFSRSAVSAWTVAISVPRETFTARLERPLGWLILGTVVLLGGSLALAWRFGGRIAGAFRGLSEHALRLGSGQVVTIPSFALREADAVGRALMDASRMLLEARHDAHHDALTGLGNRVLLKEVVDRQLALSRRQGGGLALLYIDLDDFKPVNDRFGHAAGDELLRAVSDRIRAGIRRSDLAVRLGGDEFVVAMFATGGAAADAAAKKLAEGLAGPYAVAGAEIRISVSIGIAASADGRTTSERLLEEADAAMYRTKGAAKPRPASASAPRRPETYSGAPMSR
ncbi:sensor domain-containing diguanylate cyclase [Thauera aromatica]|uniref:sensor domain-containing diguanylate cyclase n=1 Tax=Thauera aromatica TaxID=59405 RepID=UPI001FFD0F02|nr:sensor domain-containing diguanylate cyclase [Thauera aromatica]MCK2096888.1 sensor domain-containing diguanylate cyclase [Thauera aromatica]